MLTTGRAGPLRVTLDPSSLVPSLRFPTPLACDRPQRLPRRAASVSDLKALTRPSVGVPVES